MIPITPRRRRAIRSGCHFQGYGTGICSDVSHPWVRGSAGRSPEFPAQRRISFRSRDEVDVSMDDTAADDVEKLLVLYDRELPEVYGYLLHRCGDATLAEDLTSEVFLAAARSVHDGSLPDLTVAWLIAVARNKLVDHWRRRTREATKLRLLQVDPPPRNTIPPDCLEEGRALATLHRLPPQYQAALTLRYIDGLSVPEVALALGRTLHASESLLARARRAFRQLYLEAGDD